LGVLVQKIKDTVKVKARGWRVKAVINLNVYGGDLAAFRDKVHKSNWALQTMLQTINVSLSLRNNASQEAILFELDQLKSSIEEALRASIRPVGGFAHRPADHSDARVARNLRNLAQAARHFHGAASSTASTIRDGSRNGAPWQAFPGADIDVSLIGDLPSFRRERVEEYVRDWRRHRRSSSSSPTSPSFSPAREHETRPRRGSRSPIRKTGLRSPRPLSFSGAAESVTVPGSVIVATVEDDEDDDAEFERLFLDGLEELAKDRIKERDFDKAIEFLQEAMKREIGSKSDNEGFRNLQIQLALCYLLQQRWEMAEPIITGLAKNKAAADAVVCNLLHCMALVHLARYHFDKALAVCRETLLAKKKLLKKEKIDADDYAQTQGLLVMIYEMKGDWMHAEVCQSQILANFTYKHPRDEFEFLTSHPSLLVNILGDNVPDFAAHMPSATPRLYEMDGSVPNTNASSDPTPALKRNHTHNGASPLKLKFAQQLKYEADTSKIVHVPEPAPTAEDSAVPSGDLSSNGDADDEVSPTISPGSDSAVQRRFSRMFGRRRAQPHRPDRAAARPPVDDSTDAPHNAPQIKPVSRSSWTQTMLGFKKSRNLLHKASKRPNEFRLLYMERVTTENAGLVTDAGYRRQYWSPDSIGNCDANVYLPMCAVPCEFGMDDGSDYGPSCGNAAVSVELPDNSIGDGSFSFKNGVLYADTKGPRRARHQLEDVQEEHEAHVMLMAGEEACNLTNIKTAEVAATSGSQEQSPGNKVSEGPRNTTEPADPLLQSISSVLASLSEISDAEGRHAVRLDLEIMALEFKTRFRDALVSQDLQRAIDSLENDAITVPRDDHDDSGYESTESTQDNEENKAKPRPDAKRVQLPKVRSPFEDYIHALSHNRPENPSRQANLAVEPCEPPLELSPDKETSQSQRAQEPRLSPRKRFSFELEDDEVVDAKHAVTALQGMVESGKTDAIQSAIVPGITYGRSGLCGKLEERLSFDGSAFEPVTAENPPRSLSAKLRRTLSLEEVVAPKVEYPTGRDLNTPGYRSGGCPMTADPRGLARVPGEIVP
jgi:tetratricopeptide (TPR) repeat protein